MPPPTLRHQDRARALLVHPPAAPAMEPVRAQLLALREELGAELAAVDAQLRRALVARADLVDRLATCNRALVGTGVRRFPDGTSRRIRFPPRSDWSDPLDGPVAGVRPLPTDELRSALVDLLEVAGRPLAVVELRRLLAAAGWCPSGGDQPKAIANALRSPVRRGLVARAGRGRYRWVGDGDR